MSKQLHEKLSDIQKSLVAPKSQENKFGGYKYRSCEDILNALKPHLDGLTVTVSDEMICLGDRFYIKSTATLSDGESSVSSTGYAREELSKKGMDSSQITGSTSSYARKYALNGLFAIDDTKDPDATNDHGKGSDSRQPPQQTQRQQPRQAVKQKLSDERFEAALKSVLEGQYKVHDLRSKFDLSYAQEETLKSKGL